MELIIIRHGLPLRVENEDNTAADPELSETGIKQARKMAERLKNEDIDAIYSSPMKRARMTVAPLAELKGMEPVIEPGVAEFDLDSSAYIPLEELKIVDYERWRALMEGGFEAAYDIEGFSRIAIEAFNRITAAHKGERVAVVCHGGIINIFAAHALGLDRHLFFAPDYTSINRFMVASSGFKSLVCLNDAGHLQGV